MGKVFIARQSTYSQPEITVSVKRVFDHFGGIEHFVKKGERVLLKCSVPSIARQDSTLITRGVN